MKIRILEYGTNAQHDQIVHLDTLFSEKSFNDFDALVFDPAKVEKELRAAGHFKNDRLTIIEDDSGHLHSTLNRHAREIFELVFYKGGVVVCILRNNVFRWQARYPNGFGKSVSVEFGPYFLLDKLLTHVRKNKVLAQIIYGSGDQIKVKSGSIPSYLRVLKEKLYFEATIGNGTDDELQSISATDSVGRIVAAEIKIGTGAVLLVPGNKETDHKRIGAAFVQTVRELISHETPDILPPWIDEISVPGADNNDKEIADLRERQTELSVRLDLIEKEKAYLLSYRQLLFATGKHILEPAVRRAFRVLGYTVSEPDTYEGEWDLEMRDGSGALLIGEAEGNEGAVDLDKFRQALQYHNDKMMSGDDNKGLLVGNAYRLIPINERPVPFTEHAIKAAVKTGIVLIPAPCLFNAVCEVLLNNSEELKTRIQKSIGECIGVWAWPPTVTQEAELGLVESD